MAIVLKLVGSNTKDIIINIQNNIYTLQDIYDFLVSKKIDINDLSKIILITQGDKMNNVKKEYNKNISNIIYFYIQDDIIRQNIIVKVFIEENVSFFPPKYSDNMSQEKSSDHIQENINESEQKCDFYIEPESTNIMNTHIVEQLKDSDFINLLRICITKPQLLGIVNSYLSNGNIVKNIPVINDTIIDFKYENEYSILNNIDIISTHFQPNVVKYTLEHFNGHINLTLRYLLSQLTY